MRTAEDVHVVVRHFLSAVDAGVGDEAIAGVDDAGGFGASCSAAAARAVKSVKSTYLPLGWPEPVVVICAGRERIAC